MWCGHRHRSVRSIPRIHCWFTAPCFLGTEEHTRMWAPVCMVNTQMNQDPPAAPFLMISSDAVWSQPDYQKHWFQDDLDGSSAMPPRALPPEPSLMRREVYKPWDAGETLATLLQRQMERVTGIWMRDYSGWENWVMCNGDRKRHKMQRRSMWAIQHR